MGTRMATGVARSTDSCEATERAVAIARQRLGDHPVDLVMLYCSSQYDYECVLKTARQATGGVPLIGSSTSGTFSETGDDIGSVAVALLSSQDIRFFTGLARDIDKDLETAVGSIITKIPLDVPGYPHRCVFLLTDGMVGNGEEITLLVSNMSGPNSKIIGGLAADDFKMERTVVFHNDTVSEKAASICVMASKKPFFSAVNHGHCPLSKPMKITRAEDNVLYEIEGQPAWDVWRRETAQAAARLGIDVNTIRDGGEIAGYFSNFELGLRTGEDRYKVRYPMSINDDGSINFTCTIPVNSTVCIMDGSDLQQQIEASRVAAQRAKDAANSAGYTSFAGAFVIECSVRQFLLGDRFRQAPQAMMDVLGDIPMIGAETYGEMCMDPGEFSGYHNTTTVLLLLVD